MRSALAIVAGYWVMAAGVLLLYWLVPAGATQGPGTGFMAGAMVWGFGLAIAAGAVTAWLAGRAPLGHGLALAALVFVMGRATLLTQASVEPIWFHLGNIDLGMAGSVIGAVLHARRARAGSD